MVTLQNKGCSNCGSQITPRAFLRKDCMVLQCVECGHEKEFGKEVYIVTDTIAKAIGQEEENERLKHETLENFNCKREKELREQGLERYI